MPRVTMPASVAYAYHLLESKGVRIPSKRKLLREFLPLIFGLTLGLILGYQLNLDVRDVEDHMMRIEHHDRRNKHLPIRCVILVNPLSHKPIESIRAIEDGYGQYCNETWYYTNSRVIQKNMGGANVVFVDSDANYAYWHYYQHVMEYSAQLPTDWTILLDEQTFFVPENLRIILETLNPKEPVLLGRVFEHGSLIYSLFPFISRRRVAPLAGVVVSNAAINRFAKCRAHFIPRATDKALYDCAVEKGVKIINPIDEDGYHLFHENDIRSLIPEFVSVLGNVRIKEAEAVAPCCSDHAITFGQMNHKEIRMTEFASSVWKVFGHGGVSMIDDPFATDPSLITAMPTEATEPTTTTSEAPTTSTTPSESTKASEVASNDTLLDSVMSSSISFNSTVNLDWEEDDEDLNELDDNSSNDTIARVYPRLKTSP